MVGEVHSGGVASGEWAQDLWALSAGELAVRSATMVPNALNIDGDRGRSTLERSLKALDVISRAPWPTQLGDPQEATRGIIAHYGAHSISHGTALAIADGALRVPSQIMPVDRWHEQPRLLEGQARMAITFIAEGKSIKDIADALGVSEIGARAVCKDARRMMRAETMPKAVRNAYQAHWLEAPIGSPGALIQSLPPTLEIGFLRNSEGSTATGPALTTQGSIEAMAITMGILQGDMHVEGGDAVATGITGVHIRTLSRMALGQDNAEIARGIDASTEHAARSVRQIQRLLGAAGRGHAVLLAFRQELIIPRIVVRAATNS